MSNEKIEKEFVPMFYNFIEVRSSYIHYEGTNDYTKDKTTIEEIVDKNGQKVNPVWGRKWQEVSPGVKTIEDADGECMFIHGSACPVRVKFKDYHEYGEYDSSGGGYVERDFSPAQSSYYWVQYESGRKRLIKRAVYFGAVALILTAAAMFVREQYQNRLLRWGLGQVKTVNVIYHGGNYHTSAGRTAVLTMEKDKDIIANLYNVIASTKLETHINPDEEERQESDPLFELVFTYKNGKSDRIKSVETGQFIFRRLPGAGWVGGECGDLMCIVGSLIAQGVPERM